MNIYRELAENVWNPQISSGADIQRQLDLMDKLQGSSIKSSLDKNTGYDEEEFGSSQGLSQPAFTGMAMGNDPQRVGDKWLIIWDYHLVILTLALQLQVLSFPRVRWGLVVILGKTH
jgi:hypothetical protein